ncbi:MAG: Uncharacterised protein [Euryarchaeota archaeon UBA443]|nr:MAG: Uncharacterised protein [Euryarchaeota archaeon UBA443]
MMEHPTIPRPLSQAALVQAGRQLQSLLEVITPVQSLTTVMCRAGEGEVADNWVTGEHPPKPRPLSRAALEQAVQLF